MLAKNSFFTDVVPELSYRGLDRQRGVIQIWQALGLQCGPGAVPKDPHAEREGFFDACPQRLVVYGCLLLLAIWDFIGLCFSMVFTVFTRNGTKIKRPCVWFLLETGDWPPCVNLKTSHACAALFPCCSLVTPSEPAETCSVWALNCGLPTKTKRAASLLTARFWLTWQRGFSFSILPKMMILTSILSGDGEATNRVCSSGHDLEREREIYIYMYVLFIINIFMHVCIYIYVQLQQENARTHVHRAEEFWGHALSPLRSPPRINGPCAAEGEFGNPTQ